MTKNLKKVLLSIFVGVALIGVSMFVLMTNTNTSARGNCVSTQAVDFDDTQNLDNDFVVDLNAKQSEAVSEEPEYNPEDEAKATYTYRIEALSFSDTGSGTMNSASGWTVDKYGSSAWIEKTRTTSGSWDIYVSSLPTVSPSEGYVFLGWAPSSNATTPRLIPSEYSGGNFTVGTNSTTYLYPVFEAISYHASFDYNNGAKRNLIAVETGSSGSFNGSFNTTTSTWTANAISGNTYSYAKVQTYKGSSLVKEVSIGYDGARISTIITKDSTWNRLRIGFNGSTNDSGFRMDCSGLTAGKYTVSYFVDISDDRTTGTLSEIKLEAGETVSALTSASQIVTYLKTHAVPTPTRPGYTFNGWVKTSVNTSYSWSAGSSSYAYQTVMTNIEPGEKVNVSIDSAKLTAGNATRFSILLYDFTDTSIGTLEQEDVEFGEGINVTLTCPTSAISGHTISLLIYAGQSGSTAGNTVHLMHCRVSRVKSSTTKYTSSYTHSTAGNVSFMADWTPNTYTVSFDSNGGSSLSSKTVTMGSTYGPMPTPTRPGYTFDGWVNNYFDMVDFVNYYQNGQPGEVCVGQPSITSSGYLKVYSSSTYFKNSSNEWAEYGYPIYLAKGAYTLSATAYWTGGEEGKVGTYLGFSNSQIDGGGWFGRLYVNSATEKEYTSTFTISTSGTYYMNAFWDYGYNTYYKDITLTRNDGAKWQNHDGYSDNTGDYVVSSTKMVYPFNHTLVAHWTAKNYTLYGTSNYGTVGAGNREGTVDESEILFSYRPEEQGYTFSSPKIKIYTHIRDGEVVIRELTNMNYSESSTLAHVYYTLSASDYESYLGSGAWSLKICYDIEWTRTAKTYSITSGT